MPFAARADSSGTIRRKNASDRNPGVPVSTRAPRKRPRRGATSPTTPRRNARDGRRILTRARERPRGWRVRHGSGKPVAVSEAAMRRARACSASRAKTRGRRRARLPGWRRRRRRRAKFVLLLPAYPVRPARHQGLRARSRCDWERRDRRRLRRGVGTRAGFIRRRAAGETPRGGARGVALASVAGARVAAANADADADAGGFKPPFAAHAPAAVPVAPSIRPCFPARHGARGPRDPPPRRFSGNAERPDSNPRPRLRRRPCATYSRPRTGLANPCPCFSAVLSRTSAPRLLAGWTRSSAR